MKTYDSAVTAYRAAGKAHWQIDFLSIRARHRDDPTEFTWFHFCTDQDDRTETVVNRIDDGELGAAGATSVRTFLGGGHIVDLDDIVRSLGTNIERYTVVLSGASDEVRSMMLTYDTREAIYERYTGEVDQDTGLLLADPAGEFLGIVDGGEPKDGALAVDGTEPAESLISLTVAGFGISLRRQNFDMRSVEVSEQRSGDKIFKHSDSAHHWKIRWGKESKSKKDRRGDGGKDDVVIRREGPFR